MKPLASLQSALDGAIVLCFGLVPSFHLSALQLATLLILISGTLRGRALLQDLPKLGWAHILLLQFALFFILNAVLFPSLDGNMRHFQKVALESWGMTLFGFALLWFYLGGVRQGTLRGERDLAKAIERWLPLGLLISFAVMSYFFFGPQGARAKAFSTNALVPPMWFLTLSLISFCWFHQMSRTQKLIRIALMALAALMAIYSGGRMILALWVLSGAVLGVHLLVTRPDNPSKPHQHGRDITLMAMGLIIGLGLLFAADQAIGGSLNARISYTLDSLRGGTLLRKNFFRLEIWDASLQVIKAYWPLGAGQVNERLLIHEIIDRDWWFRAHQTYLSYLIAGGVPALLSGVLFQAAGLAFRARAMLPAALGLVGVLGLNGLTDSVFQSFFNVQLYMMLVMILFEVSRRRLS